MAVGVGVGVYKVAVSVGAKRVGKIVSSILAPAVKVAGGRGVDVGRGVGVFVAVGCQTRSGRCVIRACRTAHIVGL